MAKQNKPTSEWEYSHALESGDELVDVGEETELTVKDVHNDGSVSVKTHGATHRGNGYFTETFTEEEVTEALSTGVFETTDGLSHELATF